MLYSIIIQKMQSTERWDFLFITQFEICSLYEQFNVSSFNGRVIADIKHPIFCLETIHFDYVIFATF